MHNDNFFHAKPQRRKVNAKKTITELFSPEVIANTIIRKSSISESLIAVNEGDGKFTIKILPPQVQFSCICDIQCLDVNNDGLLDLIMAGNNFEFKPQFSRLDANYGNVLLNDGALNFNWQNYKTSGFFIKDEVKQLEVFQDKSGNSFVISAINNSEPKIYKLNNE